MIFSGRRVSEEEIKVAGCHFLVPGAKRLGLHVGSVI